MKKSIYDFKRKYAVQDELLNEGTLEGLDERKLQMYCKKDNGCCTYGNSAYMYAVWLYRGFTG